MNFNNMNGYEFEDFIFSLLKSMNFTVKQTTYSQDDGIDLIASFDHPILGGNYIIQCKNWQNNVGQPAVRDLFGVVMSEYANRGVLISTSDFTKQAYEFAQGKNITLINNATLNTLVEHYINGSNQSLMSFDGFCALDVFNKDRYQYLQECIDSQPKNVEHYITMVKFLFSYIESADPAIISKAIQCGILQKILYHLDTGLKKCKAKDLKDYTAQANFWKIQIYMLTGDIDNAIQLAVENKCFSFSRFPELPPPGEVAIKGDCILGYYSNCCIAMNFFSIFKQLQFEEGCALLLKDTVITHTIDEHTQALLKDENTQTFLNAPLLKSHKSQLVESILSSDSVKRELAWQQAYRSGQLDDLFFIYYPAHPFVGTVIIRTPQDVSNSSEMLSYKTSYIMDNYWKTSRSDVAEKIRTTFKRLDIELTTE